MIKIAHLTSAHPRFDPRVFHKECVSLAELGYQVTLIVADGKGDAMHRGVRVVDAGASRGRMERISLAPRRVLAKALELDADVYHLHDPELLLIINKLKKIKKIIIFDMHENTDAQIIERKWIPTFIRKPLAVAYRFYELISIKKIDALVVPQVSMQDKFKSYVETVCIANFPRLVTPEVGEKEIDKFSMIYAGGIGEARGVFNLLDLFYELKRIDARYRLTLAGPIENESHQRITSHPVWKHVEYRGVLSIEEVYREYNNHAIGLIMFNNVGQYHMSHSVKLFEYMQNGMFVVVPNFGDWVAFQREYRVGCCVEVDRPVDTAIQISKLTKSILKDIGERNRLTVARAFNWQSEEQKLARLYENLLAQ
jgi:glycosyltransferase involved in cell wall biosynthesis